ncbi:MAG: response regulator transcription factor [Ferruginibacter sp.]|nr:response regulator transcription factor [Cytophagales bacterium]
MNCIIVDDEEMSRTIVKHFVEQTSSLQLLRVYKDAIEASNFLRENPVDLLFLDVEMPKMSGIDLLKVLTTRPEVILITSKTEHAVEAFEYSVTDYLVKPITYPRFLQAVEKARQKLEGRGVQPEPPIDIYIRTDSKIVKVSLKDLLYVEALTDYVVLHTEQNQYIAHSSMKGIEKKLTAREFIRIHRSYIVNLTKIDSIKKLSVLINKKSIPIGTSYKEGFIKRLNIL